MIPNEEEDFKEVRGKLDRPPDNRGSIDHFESNDSDEGDNESNLSGGDRGITYEEEMDSSKDKDRGEGLHRSNHNSFRASTSQGSGLAAPAVTVTYETMFAESDIRTIHSTDSIESADNCLINSSLSFDKMDEIQSSMGQNVSHRDITATSFVSVDIGFDINSEPPVGRIMVHDTIVDCGTINNAALIGDKPSLHVEPQRPAPDLSTSNELAEGLGCSGTSSVGNSDIGSVGSDGSNSNSGSGISNIVETEDDNSSRSNENKQNENSNGNSSSSSSGGSKRGGGVSTTLVRRKISGTYTLSSGERNIVSGAVNNLRSPFYSKGSWDSFPIDSLGATIASETIHSLAILSGDTLESDASTSSPSVDIASNSLQILTESTAVNVIVIVMDVQELAINKHIFVFHLRLLSASGFHALLPIDIEFEYDLLSDSPEIIAEDMVLHSEVAPLKLGKEKVLTAFNPFVLSAHYFLSHFSESGNRSIVKDVISDVLTKDAHLNSPHLRKLKEIYLQTSPVSNAII